LRSSLRNAAGSTIRRLRPVVMPGSSTRKRLDSTTLRPCFPTGKPYASRSSGCIARSCRTFSFVSIHCRHKWGGGARLTPPSAARVPNLMKEWVEWMEGPGLRYEPIVRAAIAHHGFEAVHPFEDGNGRTGRLLLNLMLMRTGYPPALLLRDWRVGYIQGLAQADTGNYRPLANLIGRAVEGGLDLYLGACVAEEDAEYLPLSDLAQLTGYAAAHLGWLIRQGRLEAVKRGGRWYSTLAAVERYRQAVESGMVPKGRPPKEQR